MLFTPAAHEQPTDEPWSAEKARAAVAADAENAFDDGWTMHPADVDPGDDPASRWRSLYLGGAGVVDALQRLAHRGFVELRRDYLPYLERTLEAPPEVPDEDSEHGLWMGETGSRLVLQRLASSQANLERLAELIAANERDERCELMWGSPGTILAGRERWLARARTFAMHAAGQLERSRSEHGRGRRTLWTGDLGTAVYLADCVDGRGRLPLP